MQKKRHSGTEKKYKKRANAYVKDEVRWDK
jgi:hypothetical protein